MTAPHLSTFVTVGLHYLCGAQQDYAPPWADGQKWAEGTISQFETDGQTSITLQPQYGSGAACYRVLLDPADGTSVDWRHARAQLLVNGQSFGPVPVSWYVGCPTDMPTGIVRFGEVCGPRLYHEQHDLPAGVWAVTFRRSA